jgi:acetolactate synthase-1/2/3 large subunit
VPGRVADLFVRFLAAEGVTHVFGIPGEETLDLNDALEASPTVTFVSVRHEQGAAFIADAFGRLTGRAGVCLATLGPGATNLATGVADAYLDRAPLVALTGQASVDRVHKESHQFVDVVQMFAPITKWNARLAEPATTGEVVRKAFALAEEEKPGATHLELPEDVMSAAAGGDPMPRRPPPGKEALPADVQRAARLLAAAERPVVLAGTV